MLEKPFDSAWCQMPISEVDSPIAPARMSPVVPDNPPPPTTPLGRTEPLRVMFLMGGFAGQEMDGLLAELIRKLNPARFSPELCSLYELGAAGHELARTVPASSHVLRHRTDVLAVRRLASKFKGRIDALVTLGIDESMFWGCVAARWAHVPVALSIVPSSPKTDRLSVWNRLLMRWSDGLIADRDEQRRDLVERQHIPAKKVHVIARGIDTQRFCFQPAGAFAIRQQLAIPAGAALCGLAADQPSESALRGLLAVARRVRHQAPQAHFLLLDPPPSHVSLPSLLNEFGLSHGLHVLGTPAELPSALSATNVLVFLAETQQSPLRVFQAMAVQAPVVATAGNQVGSLVQADCTGFLVEAGDTHGFAARVVQLLNDPRLARRLGECGRQHIVKYWSLDGMVRRFEQLVGDTYLRKRSGPGPTNPELLRDGVEFCGASP